jgi:hypothetical protein
MRLRLIHLTWLLLLTFVVGCSETPAPATDTPAPAPVADTAKAAVKPGKKAPKTLESMRKSAPGID